MARIVDKSNFCLMWYTATKSIRKLPAKRCHSIATYIQKDKGRRDQSFYLILIQVDSSNLMVLWYLILFMSRTIEKPNKKINLDEL